MQFGILGPLLVRSGERTVGVPAAKQRVLLARLLTRPNQVVPADSVAEVVWDGAPPQGGPATLRAYVMRLRKVLGPDVGARIRTHHPGYLIEVAADELDLLRFRSLADAGRVAAQSADWPRAARLLAEALALWRGIPLVDVPSQMLHLAEVPQLEELRLGVTEERTEACLQLGEHSELVAGLRAMTAEHPLRERCHAHLMLALYRCGRQAEALAAYQSARQLLVSELGVEPGPELRELHQRMLAADPVLMTGPVVVAGPPAGSARPGQPAPGPRELPVAVRHFAGRRGELATLSEWLDVGSESTMISVICGTAGAGKTTLAVHWAHQVANRFPDGQLYVNLRGFGPAGSPVTPGDALCGFLRSFGVPEARIPATLEAQTGLYRSLLAGRRVMIVLDNARDAEQARPLLPGAPGCLVLITSRRQLSSLAATESARLLTLGVLNPQESRQMLSTRLGADRVAADPVAVSELSTFCAGLPLALAITAGRAATRPAFPLAELAAELRDAASRLDVLEAGDAVTSVRGVLSWSMQQLGAQAARLFGLLGLHPGPDISVPAAAGLAGLPPAEARSALAELTNACLLTEHVPGRFTCHDLLRSYAAERSRALDGEIRQQATGRMLDYYRDATRAVDRLSFKFTAPEQAAEVPVDVPADEAGARAWLQSEYSVLTGIIPVAASAGFDEHAWQIPLFLSNFFEATGRWPAWVEAAQTALAAAERLGDLPALGHSHHQLGRALMRLGACDEAHDQLRQALLDFQRCGNIIGEARVRAMIAMTCVEQDRHAESIENCLQSLALYRQAGHSFGQALTLNMAGWSYAHLGQFAEGLRHCEQALVCYRESPSAPRTGAAAIWDSLGYIHHQLGHYDEAIACYQKSVAILRSIGSLVSLAHTLTDLGGTYRDAGRTDAARGTWRQALEILDDLGHGSAAGVRDLLGQTAPAALR